MEDTPMDISSKRWLDKNELYILYGLKPKLQDKLRHLKKIPYSKIGGTVRYDRHLIDAWFEKHSVATAS